MLVYDLGRIYLIDDRDSHGFTGDDILVLDIFRSSSFVILSELRLSNGFPSRIIVARPGLVVLWLQSMFDSL